MRDVHPLAQWRIEAFGKTVQVIDDFLFQHEAVRIRAFVGPAWQPALPVWRDQTEAVPAIVAPTLEPLTALKNDMLDPFLHEIPTDRKTSLAASDDENWNVRYSIVDHNKPFHDIERQVTLASTG
ncbi:hypothetical protein D3C87_1433790 [compost metagenome]